MWKAEWRPIESRRIAANVELQVKAFLNWTSGSAYSSREAVGTTIELYTNLHKLVDNLQAQLCVCGSTANSGSLGHL